MNRFQILKNPGEPCFSPVKETSVNDGAPEVHLPGIQGHTGIVEYPFSIQGVTGIIGTIAEPD